MQKIITLTPPLISLENIKEKITCIRAHRERMFCVSTEIKNVTGSPFVRMGEKKLICHNYGQGGAGWTFLFGCVHESIRQFEQQLELNPYFQHKPITVIGAGCYGLLTAIILARKQHQVKIVAADTENIPSQKAAGFFFPRWRKSSTPQEIAQFTSTGVQSYTEYVNIIKGTHPFIKCGPKLLPAYFGLDIDPGFAPYIEKGLMQEPKKVTIDFGTDKKYDVMEYTTVFINSAAIMQELRRNIQELGINIIKQEIEMFDDIPDSIIFNCAGLGAKKLTHDKRIVPVQGHLITLKNQPDVSQLQYMINVKVVMTSPDGKKPVVAKAMTDRRDELIYFAPKESGILGITFIRGQDSLTANAHEFDRLLQRCHDFFGT